MSELRTRKNGGNSRQGTPKKKSKSPNPAASPRTVKNVAQSAASRGRSRHHQRRGTIATQVAPTPLRDTPLAEFMSAFKATSTQWAAQYVYVSFALILRAAVGLGPYSGYQQEPMHGDFEAQRHWMEITTHLPLTQWYFHDLEWWGLDYPPLTAFHSWLLGKIGTLFNSGWFALYDSRGSDEYDLKTYMRATVLVSELVIYIPALISFIRWYGGKHSGLTPIDQSVVSAAVLFQPALILIDHGHFQYNSVMLGFALLAFVNLNYSNRVAAAVFFVLALCFKQMALYYAPIIFAYMLGGCVFPHINVLRLAMIGIAVIATFALNFGPFVAAGGLSQLYQMIHRIFPFARGLWEDKVANFWCFANTFYKLKNVVEPEQLQRLSLIATLVSIAPAMLIVFFNPRRHLIPWAFSAGAWGFFLFSFQVHEKTVLVPLMPATLLLASADANVVAMVTWINNIAVFSLWPLLRREGLVLQYVTLTLCWNWLVGTLTFNPKKLWRSLPSNIIWKLVVVGSYGGVAVLHVLERFVPKEFYASLPDLFAVGNVLLSTPCFALFWLWTLYKLFQLRNL